MHAPSVYARFAPAASVDAASSGRPLLSIQLIPTSPSPQAVASHPALPSLLSCQSSERILALQEAAHFALEAHISQRDCADEELIAFEVLQWVEAVVKKLLWRESQLRTARPGDT